MKKLNKKNSYLAFGTSMLFVILVISEGLLRMTSEKKLSRWTHHNYQVDSLIGYRYIPNSEGTVSNVAYSYSSKINSKGFPGSDFSVKKEGKSFRILVLGSSDDTGLNTNGPLNYVQVLNNYFRDNNFFVEVINCSIDGKDRAMHNIRFIKNEGITYNPDLILLRNIFPLTDRYKYRSTYTQNIFIEYGKGDPGANYLEDAKRFIDKEVVKKDFRLYLFDYSYVYRYLAKYYLDNEPNSESFLFKSKNKIEGYARRRVYWWDNMFKTLTDEQAKIARTTRYSKEESLQILEELNLELNSKNIKLVLFDTYESKREDYFEEIFTQNGLEYLPLRIPFKEEYSFGEHDGHSSQVGHKAIAEALAIALIKKKFIE